MPIPLYMAAAAGASAGLNAYGTHSTNKANQRMSREQMRFQERMSSTAYQRAMADMAAAGLNPILAYSHGGASTPSGSTATMQNVVGSAANSALDTARGYAEVKNLQEQNRVLGSQADLNAANTASQMLQAEKLGLDMPKHEVEGSAYRALSDFMDNMKWRLKSYADGNSAKRPSFDLKAQVAGPNRAYYGLQR